MDVHCSTCREPWDTYHLWHDAVFDTELSHEEATAWCGLPHAQKLTERYRTLFRAAGWEFGQGVINVIRCPCCRSDAQPDLERVEIKAALEEVLGSDEDALATTFEDHGL